MTPTLVLRNGLIYTQDPVNPLVTAVAIAGGQIIAIGEDDAVMGHFADQGKEIDLDGKCVTPGLVDSHVHFRSYSLSLNRLNLDGICDLDQTLDEITRFVDKSEGDGWLMGRGWNQAGWPGGMNPSATDLDRVVPHRPAFLKHKSGHAAWVNSKALKIVGLDQEVQNPPGGEIVRDEEEQPTGILFETAIDLVSACVPKPTLAEVVKEMRYAQQTFIEAGLTGIHDFDGRSCFQALQILHEAGELQLRVVKNIPLSMLDHAIGLGLRSGFGDQWLRIGGVKMFADGALGPRTAAMIRPYEAEPENRGIMVTEKEELMHRVIRASSSGLSVAIHAIGDRANHDVLDVYEAIRKEEGTVIPVEDQDPVILRHRIEHAQLLHPHDIHRFANLGIIASMQPIHATSDMEMADDFWGERARYGYAWRTLVDSGATVVFGSDSPVEPIEPLAGIYAAVSRRRPDDSPSAPGWYPEQKLTLAEVIKAYSMAAAYTSGRENIMGSIVPGKLADMTIYDRDIFTVPSEELLDVGIAGTIIGGKIRYRNW